MMLIYMAHPIGGDVAANVARAWRWYGYLRGVYPDDVVLAPYLMEIQQDGATDDNRNARELALLRCEAVAAVCHVVVLCGCPNGPTPGMRREERATMRGAGAEVVYYRRAEPPGVGGAT